MKFVTFNSTGWLYVSVLSELMIKVLSTVENNTRTRTPISVSFSDLGFRIRAPGDLTDDELDKTLDTLYARVSGQERAQLVQLQCISNALSSVAFQTYLPISGAECPEGPSGKLKTIVRQYFQTDISNEEVELMPEVSYLSFYTLFCLCLSLIYSTLSKLIKSMEYS